MKTKGANVDFIKHFLFTSNHREKEAIEHIFKMYLVRSDEVETVKSVWKNLQLKKKKKKYFWFLAVFLHE